MRFVCWKYIKIIKVVEDTDRQKDRHTSKMKNVFARTGEKKG